MASFGSKFYSLRVKTLQILLCREMGIDKMDEVFREVGDTSL